MPGFIISVKPSRSGSLAARKLKAYRGPDLRPLAEPIRKEAVEANKLQFRSEGAAGGSKWERLLPNTIKDRQRKGFGIGPILRRTGALENASTDALQAKAGKDVVRISVRDGKLARIASIHQRGAPSRNLSARPIFVITTTFNKKIANVIAGSVNDDLKKIFSD